MVESKTSSGYKITSFGAPYNQVSSDCLKMIQQEFPQVQAIFFSSGAPQTDAVRITKRFTLETSAGNPNYDTFLASYDATLPYAAIQTHPGVFDDADREVFLKMVQFLKEKNSIFMTPT